MIRQHALRILLIGVTIAALSCNELTAPKVPVTCCRRESFLGQGQVIRIKNRTERVLALWFEANGKRVEFSIQPHAIKEYGWAEGFTVGENTEYTIGGEGFSSRTFTKDDEKYDC